MKTIIDVHQRTPDPVDVDVLRDDYTETNVSQYMSKLHYEDYVTAGSASKVAIEAAKKACQCAADSEASADQSAASAEASATSAAESKEAADKALELSKEFDQVELDLEKMRVLRDETIENAGYASGSAISAVKSANDAKISETKAKEYLDQFLEGSVFGGVWDPTVNSYPVVPTLNTTWDIVLPKDILSYDFDNRTWGPGDRLIFTVNDGIWHQLISPKGGVFSVNGQKGIVVLDSSTMTSIPLSGSPYFDLFGSSFGDLSTGVYTMEISGTNLRNYNPLTPITVGSQYVLTISITNDPDSFIMKVSMVTDGSWDHQGRVSTIAGTSFSAAKANGWETSKVLEDLDHVRVNGNTSSDLSFSSEHFTVDYDPSRETSTIRATLSPEDVGALSSKAGTITGTFDWDEATIPGSWKVSSVSQGSPNRPPTTLIKNGICLVQNTDGVITQSYISASTLGEADFYMRSSVDGSTWSEWASGGGGGGASSSSGLPVGSIVMFAHTGEIPAGFIDLSVDEPTFNVADYPNLAILYPDGKLPSYKNRYPRGAGSFAPGSTRGWSIPEHRHTINLPIEGTTSGSTHTHTGTTSTSGDHSHGGIFKHVGYADPKIIMRGTNFNLAESTTDSAGSHSHSLSIDSNTHNHTFSATVFGESLGVSDLLQVGNGVEVNATNTIFAIKATGDLSSQEISELAELKKTVKANTDKIEDLSSGGGVSGGLKVTDLTQYQYGKEIDLNKLTDSGIYFSRMPPKLKNAPPTYDTGAATVITIEVYGVLVQEGHTARSVEQRCSWYDITQGVRVTAFRNSDSYGNFTLGWRYEGRQKPVYMDYNSYAGKFNPDTITRTGTYCIASRNVDRTKLPPQLLQDIVPNNIGFDIHDIFLDVSSYNNERNNVTIDGTSGIQTLDAVLFERGNAYVPTPKRYVRHFQNSSSNIRFTEWVPVVGLTAADIGVANPNLLTNGDFSVNQRGTAKGWLCDRWRWGSSKPTGAVEAAIKTTNLVHIGARKVIKHFASISKESTVTYDYLTTTYALEEAVEFLAKTLTVSGIMRVSTPAGYCTPATLASYVERVNFRIRDTSGKGVSDVSVYVRDWKVHSDPLSATHLHFSATFTVPDTPDTVMVDYSELLFWAGSQSKDWTSWEFGNIKLEYGSVATPFVPDDPATNLLKCQRCFFKAPSGYRQIGTVANNSTIYISQIMLPTTMRATPTVRTINPAHVTTAGNWGVYSTSVSDQWEGGGCAVNSMPSPTSVRFEIPNVQGTADGQGHLIDGTFELDTGF